MKYLLLTMLAFVHLAAFSQSTFKVTYDFGSDMGAHISGSNSVTANLAQAGGTKLSAIGLVNDNGVAAYKSHITNNNATSYIQTYMRFDILPKTGSNIKITKITVTQRSSIAGVSGQSQTYLFRIGCTRDGAVPVNSDSEQSTPNMLFFDTYHSDSFEPGNTVNSAGTDQYLSVWLTARGQSTTNDEFDWFVDKIEIEGIAVTHLSLPEFSVSYHFEGNSYSPTITGETKLSASDITVNASASGTTTNGLIWLKTNANTNNIGYNGIGLYADITPDNGYEIVLKQYQYTHAGSGVAGESRVNRIGIYHDESRANSGILSFKDDFTSYAGRDIYGNQVAVSDFKTSVFETNISFGTQHFFTFSVNRTGTPEQAEYWTVDNLSINGYLVPTGRKELLAALTEGQKQLARATIGTDPGEYQETIFNTYQELLVSANEILNDITTPQATIDNTTIQVQEANKQFLLDANKVVATMTLSEANGHELIEGMSGYNSRLADSGWSFRNPEWTQAMDTLGAGWLRYMSGTRNNGFNMNIGLYEVEDLDQLIEDGTPDGGNVTCHKRVEAKGPQTVYDLYQGLGNVNARLVVTWSAFIGEPWEAALFARFCRDNHIEVDLWQFVNEPYFHVPGRNAYFWNNGTDYARKMEPIADSIKYYFPNAILAPNASWDDASSNFSKGIANYTPRFFNAFSKHTYAAYNTDLSTPLAQAVKELIGGVYYAGTESFPSITTTYGSDIPVYITESGTWNSVSSDIMMSGIYMSEYILRMAAHTNTKMVAKHSLNSAASPVNNHSEELESAYNSGSLLTGVDELTCGIQLTVEGMGQRIINKGINTCHFAYDCTITGDVMVEADNKNTNITEVPALFGGAFKGSNGKRYILVTNKSDAPHKLEVQGIDIPDQVTVTYLSAPTATTLKDQLTELNETVSSGNLIIRPFSINRIEWQAEDVAPSASRIYDCKISAGEVGLKWWTKDNATGYVVFYGTDPSNLDHTVEFQGKETNSGTISGLANDTKYYFAVAGKNSTGTGARSTVIDAQMSIPDKPVLVSAFGRTDPRLSGIITLLWQSVPDAHGYKIKYGTSSGNYTHEIDAQNVSGFRMSKLEQNQTYYLRIVAYNGFGESELSNEIVATTINQRPVAPHQVRVSENTSTGELTIQWENSLNYNYGATYNIYRSKKVYTDYELVKKGVTGTSCTFNPNEKPGIWFYTVKAENEQGESFYSSNKNTIITTVDTEDPTTGIHSTPNFKYPVKIFPVPAHNSLTIEVAEYSKEMEFKLVSMSGSIVKTGRFINSAVVDVRDLPANFYILYIKTEDELFQDKIVVN